MRSRAGVLACGVALTALLAGVALRLGGPLAEAHAAEPVEASAGASILSTLFGRVDRSRGRREPGATAEPLAHGLAPDEAAASAPATEEQIAIWIEALRDDDVPQNADEAFEGLLRAGSSVVPPLEAALWSRDEQQRFLAARILARLEPGEQWYRTGTELLATWDRGAIVRADYQYEWAVADWLLLHAPAFARALEAQLDGERRTEVAFVIVCGGANRSRREALEHLIGCLADNYFDEDAFRAVEALLAASDVLGAVSAAWPGSDVQQRRLLEHLIAHHAPADPRGKPLSEDEKREFGFWGRWAGAWKPDGSNGVPEANELGDAPESEDSRVGADALAAPPDPWWRKEQR